MRNVAVNLIDWILILLFFGIGIPSLIIMSVMPVYLIIKYKTVSALAFWEYGTNKEKKLIWIGYMGFLSCGILLIIYVVFSLLFVWDG